MSKVKKEKKMSAHRHNPLDEEILVSRHTQPLTRHKARGKVPKDEKFVDEKLTSEILKQARKQQEDLEEESGLSGHFSEDVSPQSLSKRSSISASEENDSDDDDHHEDYVFSTSDMEIPEISAEHAKAFENFMSTNLEKRVTLSDVIKDTLTEKNTEISTVISEKGPTEVEETKEHLAPNLKNYCSGPLPEGFKDIPSANDWERLLFLTKPDEWSSAAMFEVTRIFSSNLDDRKAQRFFNKILLPWCRDEIAEHHSLNSYTYEALKEALFKPAAFFKGIIIPLCKSECTLREATIFASVLAKCSIPVLHSGAALLTIAQADYQGANIIMMRTLIEKKYALLSRVLVAVMEYFLRFMNYKGILPVQWYQCLLSFVQIYRFDISLEKRAEILKLLSVHSQEKITPEIRKELSEIHKEINDASSLPTVLHQLWKI